jgi:hypothetical protein
MDRRGVTGPFEDLPSLLIVILATGLFISVAARAAVLRGEAANDAARDERAWHLLEAAMVMDCITEGEGVVDQMEAGMAIASDIAFEAGWLVGGWRLSIDWGGGAFEWSSGEPSGERSSAQASVVVDAGTLMPGRMTVVVWDA